MLRRIVGGAVAGIVKMPYEYAAAAARGAAPPAFKLASSLKADAVPELALKDVEITSADGHAVCALSKRGYGSSEKPDEIDKYHMWGCLDKDVGAAVTFMSDDPKGDNKPLLVGHDFGAAVCWAYVGGGVAAKEWQVAGYAALAVPPLELNMKNSKGGLAAIWAGLYMMFFNMPTLPELVNCFNNAWVIGLTVNDCCMKRDARWINLYRTDKLQPGAMRAQLNYYRAMGRSRPVIANWMTTDNQMHLPVLLIRGKQDHALIRDLYNGYDELLTKVTFVELDACSHWIMADQPVATNAAIDKFLTEID